MAQATAAVAEPQTTTDAVVLTDAYPKLRRMLDLQKIEAATATDDQNGANVFVLDLMEQILSAETAEDVFAAQEMGMTSGQDFVNRPFYLTADKISYRRSTKKGALPFYAILTGVVEVATGDEHTLNCGGKTFMAVLHRLQELDYFVATKDNPNGPAIVLIANESEEGAYLSVAAFKTATPKNAKA